MSALRAARSDGVQKGLSLEGTHTSSFLGTQPRMTQVPPAPPCVSDALVANGSSHTATLAPWLADMRDARTPPLPAPMQNRS